MRDLSEEQRQKNREMDIESLAKVVFRYLKDNLKPNPKSQLFYLLVNDLRKDLFFDRSDPQQYSDHAKLLEAIILLERRGLVARDLAYGWLGDRDKFMVHLTSAGIKSDYDYAVLLVDRAEEIVGALEQKIGNLDPVVRQYYLESLRAFQEGLYISSVICLGAASERAIHWLAESIESHSDWYQAPMKKGGHWLISNLTDDLVKKVIPQVFATDKKFQNRLKRRLNGMGDLYRENRNEAGHPETLNQSWSREDQEGLLGSFRAYITTICNAIERLAQKQSTA